MRRVEQIDDTNRWNTKNLGGGGGEMLCWWVRSVCDVCVM